MAFIHAQELVDRASEILETLGGLSTAAVIGYASDPLADTCVAAVAESKRWPFVDLRRGGSPVALLDGENVVVAMSASSVPRDLALWLDAIVDKRDKLASGVARRANQRLIVLCEGAANFEQLPRELKRVSYHSFVP